MTMGSRYCPAHAGRAVADAEAARSAIRARMREADPFLWSGQWRGLRAVYLKRHPYCVVCGAPAKHVDHIASRKQAPSLALEWSNLQALCVSCHTKKTNRHDGAGWVRA